MNTFPIYNFYRYTNCSYFSETLKNFITTWNTSWALMKHFYIQEVGLLLVFGHRFIVLYDQYDLFFLSFFFLFFFEKGSSCTAQIGLLTGDPLAPVSRVLGL
jgi:hypothetical protein